MQNITPNVLQVRQSPLVDESITSYEYHSFLPYSTNNFGNSDDIHIAIQNADLITLPSESRLYIEAGYTVSKEPDATKKDQVGLSDCAMPFLFHELRYELGGVEIDRVRSVGITTLLKNCFNSTTSSVGQFYNTSWKIEQRNLKKFSYVIPLKMIMGFAEDYKKVILNMKQELILVRSKSDNDALIDATNEHGLKLKIETIRWEVPILKLNDSHRLQLLKTIESDKPIPISYRTWELYTYPALPISTKLSWSVRLAKGIEKPRFVLIGFQTDRTDNITKNRAHFDNCNITSLHIFLGNQQYPYTPIRTDFANDKNKTSLLYENFANFSKNYYGDHSLAPRITPNLFVLQYPVWVVDCSRQVETVKSTIVDLKVEVEASANFPANTSAYCLVLSDRYVEYQPLSNTVRQIV